MPNNFGGSQYFPGYYDSGEDLAPNQVLVNDDLYTIDTDTMEVECESVQGERWYPVILPAKVKERIEELSRKTDL